MKVLLVSHIREEIGGGHFVVSRLANYFTAHPSLGVSPYLLMNNYADFVRKFVDLSIPCYPFELPASILSVGRRRITLTRLLRACFSLINFLPRFTAGIIRICKENGIRIIHVHTATALILLFLPAKIAGCKLLFHLHDAVICEAEGGSFDTLTKKIVWLAIRYLADDIIVVSQFVKRTLLQFDNGLARKTQVLHNGISVQSVRQLKVSIYEGSSPLIVSYGVLGSRKGFQVGIKAASILSHDYGIRVRYQIIGDGPFYRDLVRLAQELQVSDLVEFIGFQEHVHRYVSLADIVLIPSIYEEPFGLVVVEAMANSKIIIASRSGGIPEIIRDGQEGYLVPKNDPSGIAEKVIEIMKNPENANRMANNAYNRVRQEFSIERMAVSLVDIYRFVV